jgi:hypothetical protein
MMSVLLWLTVSLPFVNNAKINSDKYALADQDPSNTGKAEADDPLPNTTEEKTSNSNSITEEYLHDFEAPVHYPTEIATEFKVEHFSIYIAFYGELISPPPEHS